MRRGGQSYILSRGQKRLYDVLHVRRRAQASHAVPGESGVQPERERLRLAGKRRGLFAPHAGTARVKASGTQRSDSSWYAKL